MNKKYPIVKVKWLDSCVYTDRVKIETPTKAFGGIVVESVGWIKNKTNKEIVLFSDHYLGDEEEIDRIIVIPTGCVRSITRLK